MAHEYTEEEKRAMDREDKLEERKIRLLWRHCFTCRAKFFLMMACPPASIWIFIWLR